MTVTESVDVLIVGGGTAGLQAALQLAKVGRSVVLLERRPEGRSGARWCNGTVAWQFDRAGLAQPKPPELRASGGAAHLVSPTGAHQFTIEHSPIAEVDMRALVDRLQHDAEASVADLRWGVTDVRVELAHGRPSVVRARQGDRELAFAPKLVVDAAGANGVVRNQVPELAARCPDVSTADLCSAQQLVLEIDDPEGAQRFLDDHGAQPGDAVIAIGIEGGYSTVNINVDHSLEEVAVLTGSIPGLGHASGADLLRAVRAASPWMGRTMFGGAGLIPLRRIYDRFTAPGVALVGDAACQVMPGHGSGIGFGLMAGKVLAEAVAGASDPGSPEVLWRYQARYLREFGAILAGYDAVRRMSVKLGPLGVEELFATGIFSPPLVLPGLEQKLGRLSAADTADAAKVLAGRRQLARIVLPALAAMGSAQGLYRTYPQTPSPKAFAAWSASCRALLPRQGA